jgi:hypothetical protein
VAHFDVLSGPAAGAVAANLHDSNPLTNGPCRSLYIGVSGDVKVMMIDGSVATFSSCPAGVLPAAVQQVFSTGTTATGILALY